jgi:MraZ protein
VSTLSGSYYPKLDEKGRIILPAKLREYFVNGLVMTRGQDGCLLVFTAAAFEIRAQQLSAAPLSNQEARNYVRMFMSGAHSETPDKQGRVTIPAALRHYATLNRELTVIGAGNHAEIWDAAAWKAFESSQEFSYSSLAQEVIPGII